MRSLSPTLLTIAAGSIAVMLWAAANTDIRIMAAAAAAFILAAIARAARLNASLRRVAATSNPSERRSAAEAIRKTSYITALVYAWGGAAMLLVYRFSGLYWQHGWQYGLAMIVIAAGLAGYIAMLGNERSPLNSDAALDRAVQLAVLQGVAAAAAMVWLTTSGKLTTGKADWAANIVFMSGGLAISVISAIVARTHSKLTRT